MWLTKVVDHNTRNMSIPKSDISRFTPRQGQYLAFIYAYTMVNARPPAEADIQRFFGVSPPSAHQMVLALERNKLIRRTPRVARSIALLVPPDALPVLRRDIPFNRSKPL